MSPTSPTPSPIPESESTQTLLDDDEEEPPLPTTNGKPQARNIYDPTKAPSGNPRKIENGLTLNPSALDSKSRKPVPYANVGVKKSDKKSEAEEIKC
jgi:hypothetical protein